MSLKDSKDIDITIFGATGFTGKLVAEYFGDVILKEQKSLKIALAGRTLKKLENVRESIEKINNEFGDIELIVASVDDATSLDAMTRRTKVLITTVGPYAIYGKSVVESCIRQNCDYVDLTGEAQFMVACIEEFNAVAEKKGVAIVHTCGFDSVPSDIGAMVVVDAMREQFQCETGRVHGYVGKSKGGMSGGTIASAVNAITTMSAEERKKSGRPDALVPKDFPKRKYERDTRMARQDEVLGGWIAPWIMEGVNTRVVRRSAALLDYGESFDYTEVMSTSGAMQAYTIAFGLIAFVLGIVFAPTRWLLQRFVLPAPGQGPDDDTIVNGFWNLRMIGFNKDKSKKVEVNIKGARDPGYGCTSRMLSECALCLLDRANTRIGANGGGVLTPASAIGKPLVEALKRAGVFFTIGEKAKL